jgi:5-hydroxyisourate hydrolase-like protein (transthyretin family)
LPEARKVLTIIPMRRFLFLTAILMICSFALAETPSSSDVTIHVVKEETGKPVRNAAVILHTVDEKGKQDKGGLNLKTDSEGKSFYNGIPYGKLRVQVIARGLQTYGEDFEVKEATKEILIKLKPPQDQYSIYDDKHPAPNAPEKK